MMEILGIPLFCFLSSKLGLELISSVLFFIVRQRQKKKKDHLESLIEKQINVLTL